MSHDVSATNIELQATLALWGFSNVLAYADFMGFDDWGCAPHDDYRQTHTARGTWNGVEHRFSETKDLILDHFDAIRRAA